MKRAIILHSISDAKHCVHNKLYEGNMLFSTHSSVDVYLKEKHGLDCQCLSKFMLMEELVNKRETCLETVRELLKDLDSSLSPLLNNRFHLKLNYFNTLYFVDGAYHLLGYTFFVDCIRRIMDRYKLEEIALYDYRFNKFLNTSTSIVDLVPLFPGNVQVKIIKIPGNNSAAKIKIGLKNTINNFRKLKGGKFRFIYNRIAFIAYKCRFRKFLDSRKTILVSEPLYDLEPLIGCLNKYNLLLYNSQKQHSIHKVNLDFCNDYFIENDADSLSKIFLRDIREDFISNIGRYLDAVYSIEKVNRKYPISLGMWGGSPVSKTNAMIFEHLRSDGIEVLGSQHGCLYGEVFTPWPFDSDFSRCDYFLSWGFTREDLQRMYPSKKVNSEILPFGQAKIAKNEKALKKIDILFPITNTISLFEGGMDRVFPDKLTEMQIALLEYLNSLESLNIYIKPFLNPCYQNCSVLPVLERLKNLKIVDNISLTDFLKETLPDAVLIELPSQPLFDCLGLDTEIFLMDDPVTPYAKEALVELKKRVHYCENVGELTSKLDLFLKNRLEKKRDKTFYEHYLYKEKTKENILSLIDGLVEKR